MTIRDDEPLLSIHNAIKKEGSDNAPTRIVLTVTLSAVYDQPVTVNYTTSDGTATVAPGERSESITVVVKADKKKEANETFSVLLSGPSDNA